MSTAEVKRLSNRFIKKLEDNKFPFFSVYLFGSRAKEGNCGDSFSGSKWSDVDIAVVSDKFKNNWWEAEKLLAHLSLEVDDRIETHSFTREEFEDEDNILASEIKKTGKKINL